MKNFKMGSYVFDTYAKEVVKIINGTIGQDGDEFIPTEVMALRTVGFEGGKPVVGYTHRKIDVEHLRTLGAGVSLEMNMPAKENRYFIGRIKF